MASYGCSEDPSGRYLLVVRVAADVFFPNAARLPWAHTPRLQQLRPFLLTTNVSNKSGNLLFAQRYLEWIENVGFWHSGSESSTKETRTSACRAGGRGFEPRRSRQICRPNACLFVPLLLWQNVFSRGTTKAGTAANAVSTTGLDRCAVAPTTAWKRSNPSSRFVLICPTRNSVLRIRIPAKAIIPRIESSPKGCLNTRRIGTTPTSLSGAVSRVIASAGSDRT